MTSLSSSAAVKAAASAKVKTALLEAFLPQVALNPRQPLQFGTEVRQICLEIRFSATARSLAGIAANPNTGYIGAEVFQTELPTSSVCWPASKKGRKSAATLVCCPNAPTISAYTVTTFGCYFRCCRPDHWTKCFYCFPIRGPKTSRKPPFC